MLVHRKIKKMHGWTNSWMYISWETVWINSQMNKIGKWLSFWTCLYRHIDIIISCYTNGVFEFEMLYHGYDIDILILYETYVLTR